jgi:dipeptidase E
MRLFLSSQDFGIYPEVLIELTGNNKKVAFINNAKDDWSTYDRREKVEEKKVEFERLGFEFDELDLRGYFGKSNKLLNKLSSFGLVWAAGGNTFILRRAAAQSGLDKILKELIENDKLVYGGSSAGAILATPSLHGVEFGDDPKNIPEDYNEQIIWDGLNFVPFHIVPH